MDCPNCNQDMKLIPAGVSKTSGKPYKAFYSCPDCKATQNAEEKKAYLPPASTPVKNGVNMDMMRLAYRKDLMICLIEKFGETANNIDILSMFSSYWQEIEK